MTANPPEKVKPQTPEEKAKAEGDKPLADDSPAARFIADTFGPSAKKVEKKKDEDEAGDDADGDASGGQDEKPKSEETQKPKKKVAAKPTAPITPSPSFDEKALGKSIADNLAPHLKSTPAKVESPDDSDPTERRRLEILFHMEQMPEFKEKYPGLVAKYKIAIKAAEKEARTYKEKWLAEHPGQSFDEFSDEHSTVLNGIDDKVPDWDETDYHEAIADIRASKKFEERKGELDTRLTEIERTEKARSEQPKARGVAEAAGNDYWKELGEDFKEIVGDKGSINAKALQELSESDPVKHEIAVGAAEAVERVAYSTHMLSNGLEKFDGKNQTHLWLSTFALDREQAMLNRASEEKLDDRGRQFATKRQMDTMDERERVKHWTFSPDDLIYMATRVIAKKARSDIEREEENFTARAKSRGLLTGQETTRGEKPAKTQEQEEDADDSGLDGNGKPVSPSSAASPKSAAAGDRGRAAKKTGLDLFIDQSIRG